MKLGDVVLVRFTFADSNQRKIRPAILISVPEYETAHGDSIMMAITSRIDAPSFGDYALIDWRSAGLHKPSLAKALIQTIHHSFITKQIGSVSAHDLAGVRNSLRQILAI